MLVRYNDTLNIFIAWCGYSREFLPQFELISRNMHKEGEKDLFFVKIDGDKDQELSRRYDVRGFPTIYLQSIINGEVKDIITYDGDRSAYDLLLKIREIKPLEAEHIQSAERLEQLRYQVSHHLIMGVFNERTCQGMKMMLKDLQYTNPNFKFTYITNIEILPQKFRDQVKSELIFPLSNVDVLLEDFEMTNSNLVEALKTKINYMDLINLNLYATFDRPIVAIASTHPTTNNIGKNAEFYKVVVKFIYDGGLKNHPDFDYVILNANDIKDVQFDLQLNQILDRNFFLIILKDPDTGYRYENIIIREEEHQPLVQTVNTMNQYLQDYKNNKLRPYLKSETTKTDLVYENGILQVYGSNYFDIIHKRRQEKPLFFMLTKMNCPLCDKLEVYFERLAGQYPQFQFAKIYTERNYPGQDLRHVIYDEEMPQFYMIYSKNEKDQFNRVTNTYDEMRNFLDNMAGKPDSVYSEL